MNNYPVVDLGSRHGGQQGTVVFSQQKAASFGMSLGQVYSLDMFHAERHSRGAYGSL